MRIVNAKDEGLITIYTAPFVLPDVQVPEIIGVAIAKIRCPGLFFSLNGNHSSIEYKPYSTPDAPPCIDYRFAMREWSRVGETSDKRQGAYFEVSSRR